MLSFFQSSYKNYSEENKKKQRDEAAKKQDAEDQRIQDLEDPKDGSTPINFKARQLNYQQLRRKQAFHLGSEIKSKAEKNDLG